MQDLTTEQNQRTTDWSFEQFLAFLLIYASHADLEFSEEEKEQIKQIVSEDDFLELYAYFKRITDYQALQLILDHKDLYFPTTAEKQVLFDEMRKVFHADGDFSTLEKDLLLFLDKLM